MCLSFNCAVLEPIGWVGGHAGDPEYPSDCHDRSTSGCGTTLLKAPGRSGANGTGCEVRRPAAPPTARLSSRATSLLTLAPAQPMIAFSTTTIGIPEARID